MKDIIIKRLIILHSLFLRALLFIIGLFFSGSFISCEIPKYGTSPVKYNSINFSGTILSDDSLKPVQGIKTVVYRSSNDSFYNFSDINGNYNLFEHYASIDQIYILKFEDVDSTKNGSFQSQTVNTILSSQDLTAGVKTINVRLKRK